MTEKGTPDGDQNSAASGPQAGHGVEFEGASQEKSVDDNGPAMPPTPDHGEISGSTAPPGIGRKLAQLVVIPALIVMAGIGFAWLFIWIAAAEENLEDQVARLSGCIGRSKGPLGFQDPAYKDCWYAAYNVANRIEQIKDSPRRQKLNASLLQILAAAAGDDEGLMQMWLLVAIGRLGQPGAMEVLINRLNAPLAVARQGAIEGLLAWPDQQRPRRLRAAQKALPQLVKILDDEEPAVAARAAAALGELATADDQNVLAALNEALGTDSPQRRYVRWNTAVALARLGNDRGSQLVAALLLDREQLDKQPDRIRDNRRPMPMEPQTQDDIILSTLMAARDMTAEVVWDKITQLAENDQSPRIKKVARQLLLKREP